MGLTPEQVLQLAPDDSSAISGKKLSSLSNWKSLGRNDIVVWGECRGSSIYKVRASLSGQNFKCNCPSRKVPCKHILALLLIMSKDENSIPITPPPFWIEEWMERREKAEQRKEAKKESPPPTDEQILAKQKRKKEREKKILKGMEQLELWLADLIRNGLASSQIQDTKFWRERYARLIDAQAPGIANRLLKIGEIVGASGDWESKLLCELGRLSLIVHAYQYAKKLPDDIKTDLDQVVGWTLQDEEVQSRGTKISDDWIILGDRREILVNVRIQRTWIIGKQTQKIAMLLQFSPINLGFKETYPLGSCQTGEIIYWPSKFLLRAKFSRCEGIIRTWQSKINGHSTIQEFLSYVANIISQSPWTERFLCVLHHVQIILSSSGKWYLKDQNGEFLEIHENMAVLAIAGTKKISIIGEWSKYCLTPFLVSTDQNHWQILQTGD